MASVDIPPNAIGRISFTPSYAANALFTVVFAILLSLHVILAILYRKWYGYAIGMLCGLLLELLGCVAKVQLAKDRSNKDGYIMYIIGLTLGPTFLSSSLYLGISALLRHYRSTCFSPIGPRSFTTLFILGDFACLCFIGVGGSLAAIYAQNPIGVDLMLAGLATQVMVTAIFCVLLLVLHSEIHKKAKKDGRNQFIMSEWPATS
ncbi:conserved hypothetical protein [Talaromyces stipitatus ATCC 10500]|uniref:RTA1 domain protein n=1 Tax=Talaromyces stipitatus (strain ATCC 10500 / CBS 375.48 / QM 6759 / NRRL 1006) TaxID=441959 RepID=B8MB24_TALSN|nr:uncharacterized protein TSTA_124480 [Talaromyces stipitatus ATCC 10500]EED18725.1 conserved hypothetical protein [Talaromyces stipitatus ATCC 10500]